MLHFNNANRLALNVIKSSQPWCWSYVSTFFRSGIFGYNVSEICLYQIYQAESFNSDSGELVAEVTPINCHYLSIYLIFFINICGITA